MVSCIPFKIKLTILDQFTIGSGNPSLRGADTALASIKLGGNLVLPSSTFKGVLRKAFNRVVSLVNGSWKPCYEIEPGKILEKCKGREYEWLELFGLPVIHFSGLLRFSDLIVENNEINIYTYTHVSIRTKSLIAKEGALFTIEYLPPNTRLKTVLEICVKEHDYELICLSREKIQHYIKLILLALLEAPYVGIGRGSKPFKIEIVNTTEIREKLNGLNVQIDEDTEDLMNILSKSFDPFNPLG